MLLSVITVVRNDLSGLVKTIDSVDRFLTASHNVRDYEHIIIDGASVDGSAEASFRALMRGDIQRTVISESDRGIYDAMNKGVSLSRGCFVIFLNAGDEFIDSVNVNRIGFELSSIKSSKKVAGLAYSAQVKFGSKLLYVAARDVDRHNLRMPTIHQAMLYRRDLLIRYPYSTEYEICGDFENFCAIAAAGFTFRPLKSVLSRFSAGGISTRRPFLLLVESIGISRKYSSCGVLRRVFCNFRLIISVFVYQGLYIIYC